MQPADDEYITIEAEDYAEYDRDWEATARKNSAGYLMFEDHDLWPEIRANGWKQAGGPNLQKGGDESSRFSLYQSIYGLPGQWTHIVSDSHPLPGYEDENIQAWMTKDYPTLGDTLNAARERERGKGYTDYHRHG